MKLFKYFLRCFGRGHHWLDENGKEFEFKVCTHQEHYWRPRQGTCWSNYHTNHKQVEIVKVARSGSWSKDKDRVCAQCEKVELNATAPRHKADVASNRLQLAKTEAQKKKEMEIRAAISEPNPRALTKEEEELLKKHGIVDSFLKQ